MDWMVGVGGGKEGLGKTTKANAPVPYLFIGDKEHERHKELLCTCNFLKCLWDFQLEKCTGLQLIKILTWESPTHTW